MGCWQPLTEPIRWEPMPLVELTPARPARPVKKSGMPDQGKDGDEEAPTAHEPAQEVTTREHEHPKEVEFPDKPELAPSANSEAIAAWRRGANTSSKVLLLDPKRNKSSGEVDEGSPDKEKSEKRVKKQTSAVIPEAAASPSAPEGSSMDLRMTLHALSKAGLESDEMLKASVVRASKKNIVAALSGIFEDDVSV